MTDYLPYTAIPLVASRRTTKRHNALCLLIGALLLYLCVPALAKTSAVLNITVHEYAKQEPQLLELPDELKLILDEKIAKVRGRTNRTYALHDLLFQEDGLDIQYDSKRTFTAAQTYQYRRGNCIALAALFVASARYVGLNARFQTVKVPLYWEKRDEFYFLPGHVNVSVQDYRDKIIIEFIQAYAENKLGKKFDTKFISDKRALAEYHNNIGMEYMDTGDYDLAIKHLNRSISAYPKLDFVWSNFGVLYKFQNNIASAETMYKQALKINPNNLSSLTNLYILLIESNRYLEAEKIAKKVKKYSKKNPYHLLKLAELDIGMKRYDNALKNIKRAIRLDRTRSEFFHVLGKIYYFKQNYDAASNAFEKAKSLAEDEADKQRFNRKLDLLAKLH